MVLLFDFIYLNKVVGEILTWRCCYLRLLLAPFGIWQALQLLVFIPFAAAPES